MKLLITDLDNTLYDWVTFFSTAFKAMSSELTRLLDIDEATLFAEFRAIHQRYGDSEYPFALLELPSARRRFGDIPVGEMKRHLDSALHAFNSARSRELRLYESVKETLQILSASGVVIVGHTEALAVNAEFRLRRLGIEKHFKHLYALEGNVTPHPDSSDRQPTPMREGFVRLVPRAERKPNPRLLADICNREEISLAESWYVGDSLIRDIAMAKAAGVKAVWAEYGTRYDQSQWAALVKISHWTSEDVKREAELKQNAAKITPDHTIQRYSELLALAAAG
ncbi:HAD family hydrolase [Corallococcus exercitus]|uniref:HAD family hydrolase n=1 Tax=Corallococcus exercitus TaxID=2316736 RepID=UPI0035D4A938